jgi:hypothetical protein
LFCRLVSEAIARVASKFERGVLFEKHITIPQPAEEQAGTWHSRNGVQAIPQARPSLNYKKALFIRAFFVFG